MIIENMSVSFLYLESFQASLRMKNWSLNFSLSTQGAGICCTCPSTGCSTCCFCPIPPDLQCPNGRWARSTLLHLLQPRAANRHPPWHMELEPKLESPEVVVVLLFWSCHPNDCTGLIRSDPTSSESVWAWKNHRSLPSRSSLAHLPVETVPYKGPVISSTYTRWKPRAEPWNICRRTKLTAPQGRARS